MLARKANPAGFEPATNENPDDIGYNTKDESTTPQFQSTESRMSNQLKLTTPKRSNKIVTLMTGDIGNTPWRIDQDSETSHNNSTIESVTDVTIQG